MISFRSVQRPRLEGQDYARFSEGDGHDDLVGLDVVTSRGAAAEELDPQVAGNIGIDLVLFVEGVERQLSEPGDQMLEGR